MGTIEGWLAAFLARAVLAGLEGAGVAGLTPEAAAHVREWLGYSVELLVFVGRSAIPLWLRARREKHTPGDRTRTAAGCDDGSHLL